MFSVVDKIDNDFDTADNNNGDDDENKSVDDRDDRVEGDVLTNNKPTTADLFFSFLPSCQR